jgi:probable rRNA maturation factor
MNDPGLAIDIAVESPEWDRLPNLDALVGECVQTVLARTGDEFGEGAELSLLFCDDARIRELNREFRGKDKATNVLSFPGPEEAGGARLLGDIALAFETIDAEAREQDKSLEQHCRHMIVHGLLHLLGFDHEDPAEAEAMEATEIEVLELMGVANPYRDDDERKLEVDGRA